MIWGVEVEVEEWVRGCCLVDLAWVGLCTDWHAEDDGSGRVDQSWSSVNIYVASP